MAKTPFGQQDKPGTVEANLELFLQSRMDEWDKAIFGDIEVSLAGVAAGNFDLSTDQARHTTIILTGNPSGAVVVRVPQTTAEPLRAEQTFVNKCGGSFSTVTIKSTGANTDNAAGVSIATGKTRKVRHNGNSAFSVSPQVDSTTGELVIPNCHVYHSAAQSLANLSANAIAFNSEAWDTDTIHDTVTNNGRLTCKTAGIYRPFFNVEFATGVGTFRQVIIRLNGSTLAGMVVAPPVSGTTTVIAASTPDVNMAVNDYLSMEIWHDHGAALNLNSTANYSPRFGMRWVAPAP